MASEKIIIVVGAGASKEFGLPIGNELKSKIADLLNCTANRYSGVSFRDQRAQSIFHSLVGRHNDRDAQSIYFRAASAIASNMKLAPSIDNYLETHKTDRELVQFGKAAIAQLISEGEASSILNVPSDNIYNTLDLDKPSHTWIGRLFSNLAVARDYKMFCDRMAKIKFISFNYDRCIQQFFFYAARSYFILTIEEATEFAKSLDIEYVYGSIGPFEIDANGFSSFGRQNNILESAEKIRTFTEGRSSDLGASFASDFDGARAVVFLGFGYLNLNLEAILRGTPFEVGGIFGTGKGLPARTLEATKAALRSRLVRGKGMGQAYLFDHEKIEIVDKTCSEFMFEYETLFQSL